MTVGGNRVLFLLLKRNIFWNYMLYLGYSSDSSEKKLCMNVCQGQRLQDEKLRKKKLGVANHGKKWSVGATLERTARGAETGKAGRIVFIGDRGQLRLTVYQDLEGTHLSWTWSPSARPDTRLLSLKAKRAMDPPVILVYLVPGSILSKPSRALGTTKKPSALTSCFLLCQWRIMLAAPASCFLCRCSVQRRTAGQGTEDRDLCPGWVTGAILGSLELGLWYSITHSVKIPHLRTPVLFWLSCFTGYH